MGSLAIPTVFRSRKLAFPLVILSRDAPAGRTVKQPVSLRDLPATVVDLLGMSAESPFPGHSLAAYWKLPPGKAPGDLTSPAFSERAGTVAFLPQPEKGRKHEGIEMSVAALGYHYLRDGEGAERLYDLSFDHYEGANLATPHDRSIKGEFLPQDAPRRVDRSARVVRGREGLPRQLPPMARRARPEAPLRLSRSQPSIHLNRSACFAGCRVSPRKRCAPAQGRWAVAHPTKTAHRTLPGAK